MADEIDNSTPTPDPGSDTTKAVKKAKAALSTPVPTIGRIVMSTPVPTIGRIVIYHHPENDGVNDLAAIITNVFKVEGLLQVCLCVFEPLGGTFGTQGIKEGTDPGNWSWPERV